MRTDRGFVHEAALYGSDDEFLAVVVPFLRQGAEAGEPGVVAVGKHNKALHRPIPSPAAGRFGPVARAPGLQPVTLGRDEEGFTLRLVAGNPA